MLSECPVYILSNSDISNLITRVFAQMFLTTGFLSLDFACGICEDEFVVKFIIHFFDGFWTFLKNAFQVLHFETTELKIIHTCFLRVLSWFLFYSTRSPSPRKIPKCSRSRGPPERSGPLVRPPRRESRGERFSAAASQRPLPSPTPSSSVAGVASRGADPGASSEADASGRARAFGRPALYPRRPAIGIRPSDFPAACRAPSGSRFETVPSIRSFSELRED